MTLDELLNGSVDNLADKPEFKPYPPGVHGVAVFFKEKKEKDFQGVEIRFSYAEAVELKNPEDQAPEAKAEQVLQLNLLAENETQREFAQGTYKDIVQALIARFGVGSPRDLMNNNQGAGAIITTGLRKAGKKASNPDAQYLELLKIEFA
jgi:hypothetical protein